ncbi:MAG: hypothetical protein J6I68_14280 [Butyrivibrio sp.]|uniref:hypothetical protein n=1 Tax=Butyrivibrio sp. TaxID=28121 RepID=UPI001B60A5A5|nr:hypothetical protein [Butyrivibrio sp.]MBP3784409.1 hypothetical protein [Butyrivibrio sp.]
MEKQYIIWNRWYDHEDREYYEGYLGYYKGEINNACEKEDCMRFSSEEDADRWFCENEDEITYGIHDYYDYRVEEVTYAGD